MTQLLESQIPCVKHAMHGTALLVLLEGQKSSKILQSCEIVSGINFQVKKKKKKGQGQA